MQRATQSIWPHLALLIAAEVNENGRKRRRHPRDWHRLARLVKDLDERTKPLMEAMMMEKPPRGLIYDAVSWTGREDKQASLPLLDRLRLRLKDFFASQVMGPRSWYFRYDAAVRLSEPLFLGGNLDDRRLRAGIIHAIIRAVPTCTLWRFEVTTWFYHFRPWPHLLVAPESIEDAPQPRRRAK